MERRKVQQTGGTSFTVSLPKEWIIKNKIKKNDSLSIMSQSDGNLLISPDLESVDYYKTKNILVDTISDSNFLFRLLIGSYIMGYSKIIIKSSKKIEPLVRDCVVKFTQIAIGPEIIEESSNTIIIKDLLDPKEMPFEKTIKRMYIIAESMHIDAVNALENNSRELAEDVIKRDNDIDRLHWLIVRQFNIILRNTILCQKMGVTLEGANQFQIYSRTLERIGDHAVKIAKNVLKIINHQNIDNELIKKIILVRNIAIKEILNKSLAAWLQKDIELANSNIETIKELILACEEITISPDQGDIESSIAISYIIESIRRTAEYAGDISEIIINKLIIE